MWVENERFGRRGGNIRGRLSLFDVFCKLGKEFRDVWGTRKCEKLECKNNTFQ